MNTRDTLLAFSEWLDTEGLMKKPKGKDKRTHQDLADQFIREFGWSRSTSPEQEPVTGTYAPGIAVTSFPPPTTGGGRDPHSGESAPRGRRAQ